MQYHFICQWSRPMQNNNNNNVFFYALCLFITAHRKDHCKESKNTAILLSLCRLVLLVYTMIQQTQEISTFIQSLSSAWVDTQKVPERQVWPSPLLYSVQETVILSSLFYCMPYGTACTKKWCLQLPRTLWSLSLRTGDTHTHTQWQSDTHLVTYSYTQY